MKSLSLSAFNFVETYEPSVKTEQTRDQLDKKIVLKNGRKVDQVTNSLLILECFRLRLDRI